jgi:hypothetical protein
MAHLAMVITQFGGLPAARRAHTGKSSRHRQNVWAHPFDISGIAAGHHSKRIFLGALGHARDQPALTSVAVFSAGRFQTVTS